MSAKRRWRQSATTIACSDSRAERLRVRELRQACRHFNACEAEEESGASKKAAEAEQAKSLAFSLSASLAFSSLSLVVFVSETIPSQASSSHLTADDSESLRVRQFAPVVTKRLLIKITKQVIRFHADVGALKLALHEAPEILHRVCVNVPMRVLYSMVYNCMFVLGVQAVVRLQRIAEESATGLYVLLHMLVKFLLAAIRNGESADLPATFNHSKCDGLILAASAGNDLLTTCAVHVPRFATNERFINFHFASQLRSSLVLHGFANPMEHEPCGLLSQAEVSRDLVTADAILAVRHEPHGREPLTQWNRRLIEYSADFDRKLFPAFRRAALPNPTSLEEHGFLGCAVRTLHAIGPAFARKIVQSVVRIVEVNNRFGQCFGAFHEPSMS